MKKVLTVLLFFMLIFTACSGGGDDTPHYINGMDENYIKSLDLTAMVFDEGSDQGAMDVSVDLSGLQVTLDDFRYASIVEDGFFGSKDSSLDPHIYAFPLNQLAVENNQRVLTNAETVRYLSEDKIAEILAYAADYSRLLVNIDYRDLTNLEEAINAYYGGEDSDRGTDLVVAYYEDSEQVMFGDFYTDSTLLYMDSEGFYRVRGSVFFKGFSETGFGYDVDTRNIWHMQNVEYIVQAEEDGSYTLITSVPLSMASPLTDSDFAQYEENLGLSYTIITEEEIA